MRVTGAVSPPATCPQSNIPARTRMGAVGIIAQDNGLGISVGEHHPQVTRIVDDAMLSLPAGTTNAAMPPVTPDLDIADTLDLESVRTEISELSCGRTSLITRAEEAVAAATAAAAAARTAAQVAIDAANIAAITPHTPVRVAKTASPPATPNFVAFGRTSQQAALLSTPHTQFPRFSASGVAAYHAISELSVTVRYNDLAPVAASTAFHLPRLRPSIRMVPAWRAIEDIGIEDILGNPSLAVAAGKKLLSTGFTLNASGTHPAHIKEADTRNRFANAMLQDAEAQHACCDCLAETVTVTLQARATVKPGTATINPANDIKVLTTMPRAVAVNEGFAGVLETLENVMRHGIAAHHAASFGVRGGFRTEPIPVVGASRVFFLPKKADFVRNRDAFVRNRGPPRLDQMRRIARDALLTALDIQHILDVVCNTSDAALPPELWPGAFRGVTRLISSLTAAKLALAAIEDSLMEGWPIE